MKFDQAYKQDDFLKFLDTFLPDDFVAREEDIVLNQKRCKEIKRAHILGTCESLDLHVLELEHDKESDPRITITSDAFKIIADHWIHKALVIFKSKNSSNYRLSYLSISLEPSEKNKIIKKYSNARRYSFYLGPNASVNTPNQLLISRGRVENIEDLISRFSVDVVTNEFFTTYRETFFDIVDEFNSNSVFKKEVVEKYDIKTTDFVKKLMGQIVFLYFLQRKGWLGVKSGESWGSGDPRFMRTIFEKCKHNKENFYNDYLEPLFYDCLGKADRGNRGVTNDQSFAPQFNARIPYLNGGLFEDIYDWKKTTIEIRNKVFDELLTFFDRYNFTIDENTPTDQEVSVDPEMLGKIFENLLEIKDRKSKGTYYTPREIVHYMCRESLINYLSSSSDIPEERIRKLLNSKDAELLLVSDVDSEVRNKIHSELSDIAEKIDQLLRGIKIVDPAVGSGAFPMGMLSEISSTRYYLNSNFLHKLNAKKQSLTLYDIKRETLENCIYGVDLDPGAVEIAKLRFWLSLVVDHSIDEIEALPNLDYKIMQGNSLLEDLVIGDSVIPLKFDDLSSVNLRTKDSKERIRTAGQTKLFAEASDVVLEDIKVMHAQYFKESDAIKKKELKKLIDLREVELVAAKCDEEIARLESVARNSSKIKDVRTAKGQIEQITITLESLLKERTKPYFLWHLNFAEVFATKGGFDIVIANPPYVSFYSRESAKDESTEKLLEVFKNNFTFTKFNDKTGRLNLWMFFAEKFVKLLRSEGVSAFIVDVNFTKDVAIDIRRYLLENVAVRQFIHNLDEFESVASGQVILMVQRTLPDGKTLVKESLNDGGQVVCWDKGAASSKYVFWNTKSNPLIEKIRSIKKLCDVDGINLTTGVQIGGTELYKGVPIKQYFYKPDWVSVNTFPSVLVRSVQRYSKPTFECGILFDYDLATEITRNTHKSAIVLQKYKDFLNIEKIYIRQSAPSIIATIGEPGTCGEYSLFSLYSTGELNLRYILALLNSKLISFYAIQTDIILQKKGTQPQIRKSGLGELPIKELPPIEQKPFIKLVDQALEIKKENREAEIEMIDSQIDQMVYELYGLTPEEINIVENSIKK